MKNNDDNKRQYIVVLTRFNLAINHRYRKLYGKTNTDHKMWLDEEYLAKRFDLFERFTYPSFIAQTDHDYRWLVLFHKDTPEKYMKRIRTYEKGLDSFEPLFLSDEDCKNITEYIEELLVEKQIKDGIITTRVDNDDAVHSTFIERIKVEFSDCTVTSGLCFLNGLQYNVRSRICMHYTYINNHFNAVYAPPNDRFLSALSFDHTKIDEFIDKQNKIVVKTKIPMWVEIVHDTNCINVIWYRPSKVFVPYKVREEFPILDIKWKTKLQWVANMVIHFPLAFVRMIIDIIRLSFRYVQAAFDRQERSNW